MSKPTPEQVQRWYADMGGKQWDLTGHGLSQIMLDDLVTLCTKAYEQGADDFYNEAERLRALMPGQPPAEPVK